MRFLFISCIVVALILGCEKKPASQVSGSNEDYYSLETKIEELESKLTEQSQKIDELENEIGNLSGQIDDLEGRIDY